MPRWMSAIDAFTALKALGAGAALAAANPKNLLLSVAAAVAIAESAIPAAQEAISYFVFALLATVGVALPVVLYIAAPARAATALERMREWLTRDNAVIMSVLLLLIGVKLIGDSIAGL